MSTVVPFGLCIITNSLRTWQYTNVNARGHLSGFPRKTETDRRI